MKGLGSRGVSAGEPKEYFQEKKEKNSPPPYINSTQIEHGQKKRELFRKTKIPVADKGKRALAGALTPKSERGKSSSV